MHRYQPRIHIVQHDELDKPTSSSNSSTKQKTFTFAETQFMAVTAYQNHRVNFKQTLNYECFRLLN